jgi:hypothetical protein
MTESTKKRRKPKNPAGIVEYIPGPQHGDTVTIENEHDPTILIEGCVMLRREGDNIIGLTPTGHVFNSPVKTVTLTRKG